ncbi:MAG: hypothetical protein GWP10_19155 [Nitrospiraceae bacterium]|nr:hypothetical protein [Nitrospiraceae bacterium]
MKIILFGFDDFGEKIAASVGKKDVNIVVFDDDEEKRAKDKLYDVIKLREIDDDEIKKLENFDLLVAVLRDEDKNLFLCLTLKNIFPDKKVIAKVSEKGNEYKYRLAGVDKIINPYDVTANRIMTILKRPLTLKIIEEMIFKDNQLSFVEIKIPGKSFLEGKCIKDIYKEISNNYNILIVAIVDRSINENVQFLTKGLNHILNKDDILVVVGDVFEIEQFKEDLELFKEHK